MSLLKVDAAVRQARDTVASSVRAAASDPSHVVALSCPLGIMEPHLAMLQGDGVESLATPSAEWPLSVADMLESLHDAQDMLCAEYQHRHGRHTGMAFVVHNMPALLTLQLPGLVLKAHYADAEALARTVAQWGQPSAFNKERATQGRACMVPW